MRLRGSLDRVRSMLELTFGAERLTCIVRAISFAVFVLRKASEMLNIHCMRLLGLSRKPF